MENDARIKAIAHQAREAARLGNHSAAEQSWRELLRLAPDHAEALVQLAQQNLMHGDSSAARELLRQAITAHPDFAIAHAYMARIHRAAGDAQAALDSLDAALRLDPSAWGARMEKAKLLEDLGRTREAALSWGTALQSMPPSAGTQPHLEQLIGHAQRAVSNDQAQLRDFLDARTNEIRSQERPSLISRFEHSLDIATGRRAFVTAKPLSFPIPGLPAIMFFDRNDFPWARDVESAAPAILSELIEVSKNNSTGFEPYVKTAPDAPAGQFKDLDHNNAWSAYFLWKHGHSIPEHCNRCPNTIAAVERAPLVRIRSRAPAILFSRLEPGTHIPPHNGATNSRLTVHLPLIIPPDCGIRVGDETRQWTFGELVIFDDTIRHEAWNYSDTQRVVLIFDIWHPYLSALERELVTQAVEGMVDYYDGASELGEL